jgi:hypothetical protein
MFHKRALRTQTDSVKRAKSEKRLFCLILSFINVPETVFSANKANKPIPVQKSHKLYLVVEFLFGNCLPFDVQTVDKKTNFRAQ